LELPEREEPAGRDWLGAAIDRDVPRVEEERLARDDPADLHGGPRQVQHERRAQKPSPGRGHDRVGISRHDRTRRISLRFTTLVERNCLRLLLEAVELADHVEWTGLHFLEDS